MERNGIFQRLIKLDGQFCGKKTAEIEILVTEKILSSPYELAEIDTIYEICGKDYFPGFFLLSERREQPDFLLEEASLSYKEWAKSKFRAELEQLYEEQYFREKILEYGKENAIMDAYMILGFQTKWNKKFDEVVSSQLFGDIFRRIIMFLLTGNPHSIYHNHREFNELGKVVISKLLELTPDYNFHERLVQSVLSGLIGMDLKEKRNSTIPVSLDSVILLGISESLEDKIQRVYKETHTYIKTYTDMKIDHYNNYYQDVIAGHNKEICWMTDDYIQTIIEMKFIEEQMCFNQTLKFHLVPRYGNYSNDASYLDVLDLLGLDIFKELRRFKDDGRFMICKYGMDIGAFDGYRLSKELAKVIMKSDLLVISGARGLEMAQGISKPVYFTGIAVCKAYTETITGLDKNKGDLIFVKQDKGKYLFNDFKARATRRVLDSDTGKEIACSGTTVLESVMKYSSLSRDINPPI